LLTKSRWWLTKSSRGAGGLGDRVVEDDSDMCRESGGVEDTLLQACLVVWASQPPGGRFIGLGLKIWLEFRQKLGAACGIIAMFASRRSKVMKIAWQSDASISSWTIMPLGLSGSAKYLRALLEMCNISTNKVEDAPNQLSL